MRFFLCLCFVIIFSCKPESKSNITKTENSSEVQDESNPIMGGPADIIISVEDMKGTNMLVRMIGVYLDQNYVLDTTQMVNGMINFKNPEGYPQGLYYISLMGNNYIQVILGEDQEFIMNCHAKNITNTMKIEGSKENELFYYTSLYEQPVNHTISAAIEEVENTEKGTKEYKKAVEKRVALEKDREAYYRKLLNDNPESLFARFKLGGQNPVINTDLDEAGQVTDYRRRFWEYVDFSDRRLMRTPIIGNKLKRYMKELTVQHPDSLISSSKMLMDKIEKSPEFFKAIANWIVLEYEPTKTTLMDPEAVFVYMIQNHFTHEKAFWSDSLSVNSFQKRANEMAQSLLNKNAPNVISTDQFGNQQELLAKKADYLVVYMFNPECEHCQEQTPELINYYHKNKDEVDVFAIAIQTEEQKWRDYVKKLNFPFTTVYDPTNRSIYAKYYVDITPELYVIGPDRKIIGKNLKVFQIDTIIERDKEKRGR